MDHPEPLVIPPRTLPHKHTFILLHGRGPTGEKFGPPLLATPIPLRNTAASSVVHDATPEAGSSPSAASVTTLDQAFPHARFVFPTAARTRATIYGRAKTHQWFDCWKLDPPATEREELQSEGLQETTAYKHGLIRAEIANVPGGASNVVLGGLSQGCAASLVSLLLWEGEPLGAMFGMCGWLPFSTRLLEQMDLDEAAGIEVGTLGAGGDDDEFDPFQRDDDSESLPGDPGQLALDWLREEVQAFAASLSSPDIVARKVAVFMGHGTDDNRVSVILGRDASRILRGIGVDVVWEEYEGLGHWYSGPMLRDLIHFLDTHMGQR